MTSSCCPPAGIRCSVIAAASVRSSGAECQQHTLSTGDCDLSGISVSLFLTSSPPIVKYKCGWKSNLTDELLKKRNNLKHLKTSFFNCTKFVFFKTSQIPVHIPVQFINVMYVQHLKDYVCLIPMVHISYFLKLEHLQWSAARLAPVPAFP